MSNSTAKNSPTAESAQGSNTFIEPCSNNPDQPLGNEIELAESNFSQDPQPGKQIKMNEVFKYIISFVILSIGIGVIAIVLANKSDLPETKPKSIPQKITVQTALPFFGDLTREISGTVVPFQEIKIAAQVGGVVTAKSEQLEAGTKINKGDALITIDPQLYDIQLETAEQELQQAKDQVAEIENEIKGAENLRENTMREISLVNDEFNRIEVVGTKSEKTQAERSRLVAENSLTTLENNLANFRARKARMVTSKKVAEQKLEKAKLDKVRTRIVAPIDGVVVREMVQEGDYVRIGDPLLILENTEKAEIITNLTPTDLVWLKTNSPIPLVKPDQENANDSFGIPKATVWITDPDLLQLSRPETATDITHWQGQLVSVNGSGQDEATRTTPCRILVDDPIYHLDLNGPKFPLVRGMYVKLRMVIPVSASTGLDGYYSVPAKALSDTGEFLWAVEGTDDQKLHKIQVEVVDRNSQEDYAVIRKTEKLKEDYKIIVGPFDEARADARANQASAENIASKLFELDLKSAN